MNGEANVKEWEYAVFKWEQPDGVSPDFDSRVEFSHRNVSEVDIVDFLDTLRRLGDEGWEMVSALAVSHRHSERLYHYFRRPLEPNRSYADG
ncbi:MAG: hypothetical protein HYX94_01820 [Chloroflexi bacterium]|nr:hypothetical protein [Chloroflexota bacterium]